MQPCSFECSLFNLCRELLAVIMMMTANTAVTLLTGKIQLKGHLLFCAMFVQLRLWVWPKIFGLLLPPPIFLWVCRRQIASNPLLLLQVHGSPLMKGSRDLWDPEGPIHLFHCTKSPHALGVLIWRWRPVFFSYIAIYLGEGLYLYYVAPECSVVG